MRPVRLSGPVTLYTEIMPTQDATLNLTVEEADGLHRAVDILLAAGAREVYVFGSALETRFNRSSDIDVAVSGLPPEKFFRTFANISRCFERSVDLVDLDEENAFTAYLKSHGDLVRVG